MADGLAVQILLQSQSVVVFLGKTLNPTPNGTALQNQIEWVNERLWGPVKALETLHKRRPFTVLAFALPKLLPIFANVAKIFIVDS